MELIMQRGLVAQALAPRGDPAWDGHEQVTRFHDRVGGFGNFLMMMHGGHMDRDITAASIELYAREVQPALVERFGA